MTTVQYLNLMKVKKFVNFVKMYHYIIHYVSGDLEVDKIEFCNGKDPVIGLSREKDNRKKHLIRFRSKKREYMYSEYNFMAFGHIISLVV